MPRIGHQLLSFTLAGLPELEFFGTDEQRATALGEIAGQTTPARLLWWRCLSSL